MMMTQTIGVPANTVVRELRAEDVDAADQIFRVAFGTFLGLPDPGSFMGDAGYVRTRRQANPAGAIAAEVDGQLVGSNFVTSWGSVGFFGPLSVRPELWDRGIGRRLLDRTMEIIEAQGTHAASLFTFPHSTKHVHLYQQYDFWPRQLTAVMTKPVERPVGAPDWTTYGALDDVGREAAMQECRAITDAIYPGFDPSTETLAAHAQQLGDTILVRDGSRLVAFGVCHVGAGTEAGSDVCLVKVGAAFPGASAPDHFRQLLRACEAYAATREVQRLEAGMNTERSQAYREMLAYGFRTALQGVAMMRRNERGYLRDDVHLIDDWR